MAEEKNTIPVIIFGGHIAGYGVIRALSRHRIPIYLVCSDSAALCRRSRFVKNTLVLPCDSANFIERFKSWAERVVGPEAILMVAGEDGYLDILSQQLLGLPQRYRLTFPSWEIVQLVRNKRYAYQIAADLNIPIPKTYYITSEDELRELIKNGIDAKPPFLMKSEDSSLFLKQYQTKGVICEKESELLDKYNKYNGFFGKLLLQEMIPGGEENLLNFIITLNRNSDPTAVFINRKRRSTRQFLSCTLMESCWSEVNVIEGVLRLLKKIAYYGYVNPELKYDSRDKKYKLVEINGRVSMSNSHALKCGCNTPLLMYQEAVKRSPAPLKEVRQSYQDNILWWYPAGDMSAVLNLFKNKQFSFVKFLKSLCGKGYIIEPFNLRDPFPALFNIFGIILYPFSKIKSIFVAESKI